MKKIMFVTENKERAAALTSLLAEIEGEARMKAQYNSRRDDGSLIYSVIVRVPSEVVEDEE